jgi:hypothetical protein
VARRMSLTVLDDAVRRAPRFSLISNPLWLR